MLTQEPGISLGTCQTDTVDSGLLAGADTDGLAVISEADGVGLGILQRNQRDDEVDFGIIGQFLVFGHDVFQQMLADLEVVAALLEGDTENLLVFHFGRNIVRINSHHIVATLTLS